MLEFAIKHGLDDVATLIRHGRSVVAGQHHILKAIALQQPDAAFSLLRGATAFVRYPACPVLVNPSRFRLFQSLHHLQSPFLAHPSFSHGSPAPSIIP